MNVSRRLIDIANVEIPTEKITKYQKFMINMQNTKGLITLSLYMVVLLLFPVFSGLEEVFVGISLSFTVT